MNTTNLFTLDTAIVAAYLLITLIIGLRAGRGITTMQDYVIGTSGVKTYGTPVLVATLFATEVGGGSTIGLSEKIFATGLIWLFAYLGVVLGLFLVAFFVAPHLGRFDFTGKLSVGEMMGGFYGTPGRVVTGIAGTIRSVATTGVQIAAMGYLFQYFFNMPSLCGILISCGIVVIYSSFGGIRSVTATDIVQFSVLVIIIPIIAARMLHHAGGWDTVCAGAPAGHFHLLSHKDLLKHAFTFFVLIIPNLDPAYIQRLLMARGDVKEAYNALISAGCLRAILICLVGITAFAVVASQPHLDPRHTYLYAVNTVLDTGYKGLGIAGLFAIIMSSADSYLHAAGVSFVHDVVQPLYKESLPSDQELKLTRFVTLLLGISAILGVLIFKSILDLALASLNLWLPVVIVPLLSGIVGYFSSTRTFCVAVTTGLTTVGLWKLGIEHYVPISSTIPAMVANLIAFVIARQFDHVGNIYFDPDDPMAQMAKVKMTKRAEQQAQTVARMSLAARVTHAARACLVVPVAGLLRFLWTRVTTFGWVHTSCEQREERYGIPSWKLILLSIAALGLSVFLETKVEEGFGGALTGLRMFAGCLWLFLAFQELFTWSLLRQHGATWCFGALIVAWPFVTTFALLVHGDHWLPFGLWAFGLLLPFLLWDAAAGFWVGVLGVLPGAGLYHVLGGTNTLWGVLQKLPVEAVVFALFAVTGIAVLAHGREMAATIQLALLKMKQAFNAHEAKKPLIDGRDGGEKLKEHMPDLIAAHKKLAADSGCAPKTEDEYRWLERLPEYLRGACQDGLDFMNALIQEGKDPVGHEPPRSIVAVSDCVAIAKRYADLSIEVLERVHVDIKHKFLFLGHELETAHMFRNAMKNAARHTDNNQIITVWTRVVPGDNQLIVQDFGSGILARFILWILTVFYTQSADGTGVGLGICDRGMHRIGGRVTVWSLWGVGTMIIFHFPPAPAEKIREHEEQLAQERRRQEEERAKERRELQEQLARARAQLEQIPPRLRDQARTQIRELERRVGAANVSS